MATEQFLVSLATPLVVPGAQQMPQGYYRSKLFIAPLTTNPLVAAAGPLLSLLERLCVTPSLPPIAHIRDNIEHELRAFRSRLLGKTQAEELDVIADYLICATIDELLGKNYLRLFGKVAEFKAFTPSSHDEIGPERRFFDIVHHIKQKPNQYLDILELAYYCLIAGFEGEQHGATNGRQILDNLIEELYQLIQQYRVNKPYHLFHTTKNIGQKTTPEPQNYRFTLIASAFAFLVLVSGYFISHTLLENQAKMVQLGHHITAKLDD